MLRKLLKHEFRATGRIMLPVYLILLAAALGANLSMHVLLDTRFWFFNLLGGLLLAAFFIAVVAVFVVAFVLMIQRFYKNLLQDEGYVMLTLPVSIHQHIWSKLIVSSVWFIATVLAVILASFVMVFSSMWVLRDFFSGLWDLIGELSNIGAYYAVNGTALLAELAALTFLSLVAMCLQFYAALAAGHSLPNHKMAWSVVWFFGLQFATQVVGLSLMQLLDVTGFFNFGAQLFDIHLSGMSGMHVGLLLMMAGVVVYGAVYYLITVFFLKRRLNLE